MTKKHQKRPFTLEWKNERHNETWRSGQRRPSSTVILNLVNSSHFVSFFYLRTAYSSLNQDRDQKRAESRLSLYALWYKDVTKTMKIWSWIWSQIHIQDHIFMVLLLSWGLGLDRLYSLLVSILTQTQLSSCLCLDSDSNTSFCLSP